MPGEYYAVLDENGKAFMWAGQIKPGYLNLGFYGTHAEVNAFLADYWKKQEAEKRAMWDAEMVSMVAAPDDTLHFVPPGEPLAEGWLHTGFTGPRGQWGDWVTGKARDNTIPDWLREIVYLGKRRR